MLELKQKIAKNFIISFGGRFVAGALGIVSFALIARTIGVQGMGAYATALAFLYVFQACADFGLDTILTREISKPNANEKEIVGTVFVTRLLLLVFSLGLALLIAQFTPYSFQVKHGIIIASAGFFFLSLSSVLMGVFQKHLKTIIPAVADIAARVVQLAFVWYLYQANGTVLDFLWVFVAGAFIHFSLIYYFVKKYTLFQMHITVAGAKKILHESWPLAVSTIMILIYFKGDTLILSFLHPSHDVGIYNVAYKILENIIFFPAMFVGLIMPLLSRYFVSDKALFQNVFQKTFDFLALIAVPMMFGGIYLAGDIITIISGQGFVESVLPLQILLIALTFIFFGSLFCSTIVAIHKQKIVMYAYASAAVFNVAANFYFISRYSYIGAALVTVLTEFFITLAMLFIIYKATAHLPRLETLGKAFCASLGMSIVLWAFPVKSFIILFPLACATYFVFLYLLKGFSKDDLALFMNALLARKSL